MKNMIFYQYRVQIIVPNELENYTYKTEEKNGLVAAKNFNKAVERLCLAYGEENITEILKLTPICEDVFEFELANAGEYDVTFGILTEN